MTYDVAYDYQPDTVGITLGGQLTIDNAGDLKSKLLLVLAEDRNLHVRLANVEKIDMTFAQVICALDRSLKRRGRTLSIDVAEGEDIAPALASPAFFAADCAGADDDNHDCIWTRIRDALIPETTHGRRD